MINYQGQLAGPSGAPLPTGEYTLSFSIYDSATNNDTPIWGPQIFDNQQGLQGHGTYIPVVRGYFNVILGPWDTKGSNLVNAFNATNRYVQVTISNNQAISPRQQILATPFAFQAANSAALAGADWSAVFGTNDPVNGTIPSSKLATNLTLSASNLSLGGTLNLPAPAVTMNSGTNLFLRADGAQNVFLGLGAGNTTLSGSQNLGLGAGVLSSNTSGLQNTATGNGALAANTTGSYNTAGGVWALASNTSGSNNTANGVTTLFENTSGSQNTAIGVNALFNNSTGNLNTAIGFGALTYLAGGSGNLALGYMAGVNVIAGNGNVDIASAGQAGDNATIRLGVQGGHTNTFIAGISGASLTGGLPVYVNSVGQLGTQTPRQTGASVGLGGLAVSLSSGQFSLSGMGNPSGDIAVSNLTVTVTTTGTRPVLLLLVPDTTVDLSPGGSYIGCPAVSACTEFYVTLYRGAARVGRSYSGTDPANSERNVGAPGAFSFIDFNPPTGTNTYSIYGASVNGNTVYFNYVVLVAYEL